MTESSSKWHVSKLTESDVPEICKLFRQVFKTDLSPAHWNWKYVNGGGVGIVVRDEKNQIAAYYGGVERRILDQGRPALTLQCCDTMVAENQRGTLSKKGPYFLAATSFLEAYIGFNRPYLFGFGFPNKRVMRLGEHLGVQASIGNVVQIEWEPAGQNGLAGEVFDISNPDHCRLVDLLWQEMSASMHHKIITVRDQAYIQYRFLDHPGYDYQLVLVKHLDETVGLLVFRIENQRLLVLDTIASSKSFRRVINYSRNIAQKLELGGVYGWVTEADIDLFADDEMTITDIGVRIPTSICTDGPTVVELMNKWYLTAGDTDFL